MVTQTREPMSDSDRGQVNSSAAQFYEQFFVPSLFQEWGDRVADAALLQAGQRVLDVACGTGALARVVAERVGSTGEVVGLDINDGMLAIARRKIPSVTWQQGPAEAMPFEDNYFDAVVSQFGLMFFEDRPTALKEMFRVLRPGGHLAVAVWDSVENTPAYAAVTGMLDRLFGEEVGNALRSPYNLGDKLLLKSIFTTAGISGAKITTVEGTAHFSSIKAWVSADVKGWTLDDMIDETQFQHLLAEAEKVLQPFVSADGTVAFTAPAHIVTAVKR